MKKQFIKLITLIAILSLLTGSPAAATPAPAIPWQDKVDAWVLTTAAANGETEFLVFMFEQADLSPAAALGTKSAKGAFVYATLTEVAARTQKPVRASLDALGVEYRPYWAANMLWVRAEASIIQALAQRSDVAHIFANPSIRFDEPEITLLDSKPQAVEGIEWNISKINAPAIWALGYSGQGVVIGGQDTGYDWDHPALKDKYRGWNGTSANHDYNWHDTVTSGGGSCGANSPEPCDDHGHGTHTMGSMVGDDGGSHQIGVAPGAKWIGCRNMNVGVGTPESYTECYQWFIAPTRVDGSDPRPDLAPDVINNSWACPASEGCNAESLRAVVQNVHAAGIVTAHSAGNSGSSCGSINTPAAIYPESFTVGSTNSSDNIAGSSSRGPVTVDGSNLFKPNISAPGVSIYSSYPGGGYTYMSGTSMAAPHVAGLVALLISAHPALAGQVDVIETIIEQTAVPRYTTDGCGGDTGSSHPNHTYGWGRVDAWAAYQGLFWHDFEIEKTASAAEIAPGGTLTYTLAITHTSFISATNNVVLTDTIPAGTDFVTATLPYTLTGDTLRWDFASLAAGASGSVNLVVEVSPETTGTVENLSYGVRSDEVDTVMGDPVQTQVVPYNLGVAKTVSTDVVVPGNILTYTLVVDNLNLFTTTHNVVLTDSLPAGTNFITATLPHTLTGDLLTWNLGDMGAGASAQVGLVTRVRLTATGTISNAQYGVVSREMTTSVGGAPVSTFVHIPGVALTADNFGGVIDPCDSTQVLTYEHTITNTGNYTDTFGLALTTTQGWASTVPDMATLAPGETATIAVEITPPCGTPPGSVDITTLTATSQANPNVTATVTDTTTVLYRWFFPLMLTP